MEAARQGGAGDLARDQSQRLRSDAVAGVLLPASVTGNPTTQAYANNPDDFVSMEPTEIQFPNPGLAYFQK